MSSALQTVGWTIVIGLLVVAGCAALTPEPNTLPPNAPCLELPWHSSSAATSADPQRSGLFTSSGSTLLHSWHARYERYYRRTFAVIEAYVYRFGWSVAEEMGSFLCGS